MSAADFLAAVDAAGARLQTEFEAICGFGGRLQGTPSLDAALGHVRAVLGDLGAGEVEEARVRFHGWTAGDTSIVLPGLPEHHLDAAPLVGSVSTPAEGLLLDVIDLGRGTPDEIATAGAAVRGKAVLLRHEYAFSTDTVHRRAKLDAAAAAGAAAAVMVQPLPGLGPVSGGANRCPIPGFGLGIDDARRLAAAGRARFHLSGQHAVAEAVNLILDLPGGGDGRVVLSAHLDGHPMAESAMDNATGVAGLLTLAREVAPFLSRVRRGLTVCVFSAEEWSLSGSRAWLRSLPEERLARMALNLNLDSIAGSPRLTALISGYPALDGFVRGAAEAAGAEVAIHRPIMVNSDHANFAGLGVPALRLIAGFGELESRLARLLTRGDTRDCAVPGELLTATRVAGAVLWRALTAGDAEIARLREGADDVTRALRALSPLPE